MLAMWLHGALILNPPPPPGHGCTLLMQTCHDFLYRHRRGPRGRLPCCGSRCRARRRSGCRRWSWMAQGCGCACPSCPAWSTASAPGSGTRRPALHSSPWPPPHQVLMSPQHLHTYMYHSCYSSSPPPPPAGACCWQWYKEARCCSPLHGPHPIRHPSHPCTFTHTCTIPLIGSRDPSITLWIGEPQEPSRVGMCGPRTACWTAALIKAATTTFFVSISVCGLL